MERLTEEKQIGPFASLKDKAEDVPGAFGSYDCLYAHMVAVTRLKQYEDTGLEPEEITAIKHALMDQEIAKIMEFDGIPVKHLIELAQVEKDRRLIVPPCKVGDMVYEANKRGFISIYKVISIHISDCSMLIGWELVDGIYSNLNGFEVSALGKTVFLTREEAEAALKKREEEDSEAVR